MPYYYLHVGGRVGLVPFDVAGYCVKRETNYLDGQEVVRSTCNCTKRECEVVVSSVLHGSLQVLQSNSKYSVLLNI